MTLDVFALTHEGIKNLQPYAPGKPKETLQRELGVQDSIKLASNENPLGPSPLAKEAALQHLDELHEYPDPSGYALKQALGQHLKLNPNVLTLGNGSNDVIELIIRAFVQPGQAIMVSQHAFIAYEISARAVGAQVIRVPDTHWQQDCQAMLDKITSNLKLICIANPNNPTGTFVNQTDLRNFLEKVPEDILVVIDEAYFEYILDPEYPQTLDWLETFENLIVTRTFSKAYGLAGLRVGYSVSSVQICDILNRIRQPFNVNRLGLVMAQAALRDQRHLNKSIQENHQGLKALQQAIQDLGLAYIPSVGNFLCIQFEEKTMEIYQHLLSNGLIVRPLQNYQMHGFLRVTIGTCDQMKKFVTVLKTILLGDQVSGKFI